jgi:hypothetical protein
MRCKYVFNQDHAGSDKSRHKLIRKLALPHSCRLVYRLYRSNQSDRYAHINRQNVVVTARKDYVEQLVHVL